MKKPKLIILDEKKGLRKIRLKFVMALLLMVVGGPIVVLAYKVTNSDTVAFILIFALFLTIIYLPFSRGK